MGNLIRLLLGGSWEQVQEWAVPAQNFYRMITRRVVIPMILTLVVGIMANFSGYQGVNWYFAITWTLVGVWLAAQPAITVNVAAFGVINGARLGTPIVSSFEGALKALGSYGKGVEFLLMWGNIFFVVLALVPFEDDKMMLGPLMVLSALAAQFVFWLGWEAKVFYKVSFAVVCVSALWILVSLAIPAAYVAKAGFNPEAFTVRGSDALAFRISRLDQRNADAEEEKALQELLEKARRGQRLTPSERGRVDRHLQRVSQFTLRDAANDTLNAAQRFWHGDKNVVAVNLSRSNWLGSQVIPDQKLKDGAYRFEARNVDCELAVKVTNAEGRSWIETHPLLKNERFRGDVAVLVNGQNTDHGDAILVREGRIDVRLEVSAQQRKNTLASDCRLELLAVR